MNFSPTGEDVSREAWQQNYVGIWYGAWTHANFVETSAGGVSDAEVAARLSGLEAQKTLRWNVRACHVQTARRFYAIEDHDWVFTYFDQAIHLARIGEALPEPIAAFGRDGELFKARCILDRKSFRLQDLPEAFRLLPCAGRGNVHRIHGGLSLVEILAQSNDAQDVLDRFSNLDWTDLLPALGPKGWETLCAGYLILEAGFVPTGLGVGGTLPDFDIVGRNRDGKLVLAQCKKTPGIYNVDDATRKAFCGASDQADRILFAYDGAAGVPGGVRLFTKDDFGAWFEHCPKGQQYRRMLMLADRSSKKDA
jgi:hypothetical protein